MFLAALALTANAYSDYFVSIPSSSAGKTGFASAVSGSQLTVADVDEIKLRLEALPRFAEFDRASTEEVAVDISGDPGLISQNAPIGD